VFSGGISKPRSKPPPSTVVSTRTIPSAPHYQPLHPQPTHNGSSESAELGENPDISVCSTTSGGVAERLVMYSQKLIGSFGCVGSQVGLTETLLITTTLRYLLIDYSTMYRNRPILSALDHENLTQQLGLMSLFAPAAVKIPSHCHKYLLTSPRRPFRRHRLLPQLRPCGRLERGRYRSHQLIGPARKAKTLPRPNQRTRWACQHRTQHPRSTFSQLTQALPQAREGRVRRHGPGK
jgi:hypothetical protein